MVAAALWATLVFHSMVVSRQCVEWSILLMFFIVSIVLCAVDTGVACKRAYADDEMDVYEPIEPAATVTSLTSSTSLRSSPASAARIALVCFRVCSAFVVLALVVTFSLFESARSPSLMPLRSQYLENDVTVSIAEGGELVHIRAKTLNDLFFAQGQVTAERRLWQIEFQRLVGQGNLSTVVGEQVRFCIDTYQFVTHASTHLLERLLQPTSP